MIPYLEEPIAQPSIAALYCVSKLAAKHVKIVLSGQGADELLGGYDRYIGEKYLSIR
ncbi:MAG: asparagine synthase-related protein [Calditrichia bacterium]